MIKRELLFFCKDKKYSRLILVFKKEKNMKTFGNLEVTSRTMLKK